MQISIQFSSSYSRPPYEPFTPTQGKRTPNLRTRALEDVKNYSPISLISIPYKIHKRLIYAHIESGFLTWEINRRLRNSEDLQN